MAVRCDAYIAHIAFLQLASTRTCALLRDPMWRPSLSSGNLPACYAPTPHVCVRAPRTFSLHLCTTLFSAPMHYALLRRKSILKNRTDSSVRQSVYLQCLHTNVRRRYRIPVPGSRTTGQKIVPLVVGTSGISLTRATRHCLAGAHDGARKSSAPT